MKLRLERSVYSTKSTIGKLYIDNVFFCHTLEDVVRPDGIKIYGETAIPDLIYNVTLSFSNRFQKLMPLVYNTENLTVEDGVGVKFSGIRIHSGNTDKHTLGCILVGETVSKDFVGRSRIAFNKLMDRLKDIDIVKLEVINKI